ncbi:hypothetical protein [Leptospira interrogans]|uniref:hypothetical protein n=1 Tax=Leptospira interrogans TaxID=173 RepID=UPI000773F729|nr:hypothetical protein [Leptospira interrogans]
MRVFQAIRGEQKQIHRVSKKDAVDLRVEHDVRLRNGKSYLTPTDNLRMKVQGNSADNFLYQNKIIVLTKVSRRT